MVVLYEMTGLQDPSDEELLEELVLFEASKHFYSAQQPISHHLFTVKHNRSHPETHTWKISKTSSNIGTLTLSSNKSKNFASAPAFTFSSALTSTHPCGGVVVTFDTDPPVPLTVAPVDALRASVAEASRLSEIVADARPSNASRPISSFSRP